MQIKKKIIFQSKKGAPFIMVRRSILLIIVAFSLCTFAETVTKSSVAFQFPTAVSASAWTFAQANEASFNFTKPGKNIVEFSWNLPKKTIQGNISIFTVSGAKVKSFPFSSSYGTVQWNTAASGIYFAQLSGGSFKKNLQIFLYR